MSDNLKFTITPERAHFFAENVRKEAETIVEGADELVEDLLNLFNGKNASSIAVSLSVVLALVDKQIQEDGSTGAAKGSISIADVVKTGVPIYKRKVDVMELQEKVFN